MIHLVFVKIWNLSILEMGQKVYFWKWWVSVTAFDFIFMMNIYLSKIVIWKLTVQVFYETRFHTFMINSNRLYWSEWQPKNTEFLLNEYITNIKIFFWILIIPINDLMKMYNKYLTLYHSSCEVEHVNM